MIYKKIFAEITVNYLQDHHIVLEPHFHIHYETHQEVRLLDSLGFLGLYLAYIFVVLLGRFIHNRNRVDLPYAGVLTLFLYFFLPSAFAFALVDLILPNRQISPNMRYLEVLVQSDQHIVLYVGTTLLDCNDVFTVHEDDAADGPATIQDQVVGVKGLASYCKAETTFTFHFSIINA